MLNLRVKIYNETFAVVWLLQDKMPISINILREVGYDVEGREGVHFDNKQYNTTDQLAWKLSSYWCQPIVLRADVQQFICVINFPFDFRFYFRDLFFSSPLSQDPMDQKWKSLPDIGIGDFPGFPSMILLSLL